MPMTVAELAGILGLGFQGNGAQEIHRISSWEAADSRCLAFYDRREKGPVPADQVRAGCVIAPQELLPPGLTAIRSSNPKLDFARAASVLLPAPGGTGRRHPTAVVSAEAHIEPDVDIGPWCVIGARASILRGSILGAGVVVGDGCRIGVACTLHPGVVLYPGATLGDRVVLHAGVVIGGDGFGYVFDGKAQVKFPQAGSVVVEDDVEVGCNTTIDRGSLGVTRIGAGSKIDNLVQIAHNVEIGRCVVIAAQTGISGSTVIEDNAVIGGQVGFGDHARVQRGVVIGSKAGILPGKIVRSGDTYWGVPVRPLAEYKRLNALFGRLPCMKADIDALKSAVEEIRTHLVRAKPEP